MSLLKAVNTECIHRQRPVVDRFEEFKSRSRSRLFMRLIVAVAVLSGSVGARGQSGFSIQVHPSGTTWEIRWRADSALVLGIPNGACEIQRSEDLRSWQPLAVFGVDRAVDDGWHRYLLDASSGHGFYRVQARPAVRLAQPTAEGGADVFGYSTMFLEELARLGQQSVEEFAARHPQPEYAESLGWDPTTAMFWREFNTAPEDKVNGEISYDFRLDARELEVFKRLGFVVSERLGTHSFAEAFYRIWDDDLPVFVSTDAILQAWHRSYDSMLIELASTSLPFLVNEMLEVMAQAVPGLAAEVGDGLFAESVEDADFFLTVARSLMWGRRANSALNQIVRVDAVLLAIREEKFVECFDLFGHPRAVDFSQFKVRGHYEDSEQLSRYFQCMMWLGRIDLRVAGPAFRDCREGTWHQPYERELGTAIVLHELLRRSGSFEYWQYADRVIQAFVGWSDSMNFAQMGDLLGAAGITRLADIGELAELRKFQEQINESQYGVQHIKSDSFAAPLGPSRLALPRSFAVMGQKFVVDSWALAKLVYDDVLWVENGQTNEVPRRMPSALEVAYAVLANSQTAPNLVAGLEDETAVASPEHMVRWRDGMPYQHNLEAVRAVLDAQTTAAWEDSIYAGWLDVLRTLSPATVDSSYPDAMRTRAWAMKTLNTQLASWTALRHDILLYAKPSYTPWGECSYPDGYVEPRPEFFARLQSLAQRTRKLIAAPPASPLDGLTVENLGNVSLGTVQSNQVEFLNFFAGMVSRLGGMAERELRGQRLTRDDVRFLDTLIQETRFNDAGGPRGYDGWYTRMFYKSVLHAMGMRYGFARTHGAERWDAITVDVHKDLPDPLFGDPGGVLHQGIGNVHLLFLAVDHGGERVMYAGPVHSHYEYEVVGPPQRLSDADWREGRWEAAGFGDWTPWRPDQAGPYRWRYIPPHPEWTRSYLVPHPTKP
jgi:hypothetical protein